MNCQMVKLISHRNYSSDLASLLASQNPRSKLVTTLTEYLLKLFDLYTNQLLSFANLLISGDCLLRLLASGNKVRAVLLDRLWPVQPTNSSNASYLIPTSKKNTNRSNMLELWKASFWSPKITTSAKKLAFTSFSSPLPITITQRTISVIFRGRSSGLEWRTPAKRSGKIWSKSFKI